MIDPRSEYIIYKEREERLMEQINHKSVDQETHRPWYEMVSKWLGGLVFGQKADKRSTVQSHARARV